LKRASMYVWGWPVVDWVRGRFSGIAGLDQRPARAAQDVQGDVTVQVLVVEAVAIGPQTVDAGRRACSRAPSSSSSAAERPPPSARSAARAARSRRASGRRAACRSGPAPVAEREDLQVLDLHVEHPRRAHAERLGDAEARDAILDVVPCRGRRPRRRRRSRWGCTSWLHRVCGSSRTRRGTSGWRTASATDRRRGTGGSRGGLLDLLARADVDEAKLHAAAEADVEAAPRPRGAAAVLAAVVAVDRDGHLEAELLLVGDL
jgi:hypothetical protein